MYKVLFLHYYRIYKYFQLAFIFIFSCVTLSTFARFYKPYRVTPLLFFEEHPGIFNDHRESHRKDGAFSQYSVPATILGLARYHFFITDTKNSEYLSIPISIRYLGRFFLISVEFLHPSVC